MAAAADTKQLTAHDVAVSLDGIRKRFGYREVLRGIRVDVARGGCLALFGANGAGKSTLLRIIATLSRPSAGQLRILGMDVKRHVRAVRARLGVVFHQSFLRPELTLEENMRFFQGLYGGADGPAVLERAERFLERFGISSYKRQPVKTFSQGMLKRANLVRSLMHDPDLWLLDEPFSGLDPEGRELLTNVVKEYVGAGGTAILVTHQTELGRSLASRTVTLENGMIAPTGDRE